MMRLFFLLVTFLWGLLASFEGWAQNPIILKNSTNEIPLYTSLAYFKDSTNQLDLEAIKQQKFIPHQKAEHLNFGFSSHTYWLRFTVQNQSAIDKWFLYSEYPILDSLFLYEPPTAVPRLIGDQLPFSERAIPNRFPILEIAFATAPQTYYLKIRTQSSVQFPFILAQKEYFYQHQITAEAGYGIYYGTLIVMIAYNLFLFFSIRHISYLAYSVTIFFNLMFFANVNAHTLLIWGDYVRWANLAVPISMSLLAGVMTTFASLFLETALYSRFWYKIFNALIFVAFSSFLGSFFLPYSWVIRLNAAMLAFLGFAMMGAGWSVWRKGNAAARFFLLAWVSYIFGGLLLIFRNFGLIASHNFLTAHSVEIGNALEVILLSFALADKYNMLKKEKELAQQKLLETAKEKEELVLEQNKILELKVTERTNDLKTLVENLNQTNEELSQTLEQLEEQRHMTTQKHLEIQRKNDNITSSLNYARRIQTALLPKKAAIQAHIGEFLLFYEPKDIVSGDFYWFAEKQFSINTDQLDSQKKLITDNCITEICILAVADCTGHGVPGAFMTVIGNNLLDQIINKDQIVSPAEILKQLDYRLLQTLKQQGVEIGKVNDGMDIAMLAFQKTDHLETLIFASAKRPIWIFEQGKNEPTEYKGDKFPIGSSQFAEKTFTETPISLHKGDMIYAFTDGYADQFGEAGKFTIKKFRQLLVQIHAADLPTQAEALAQHWHSWKGTQEQTDDVLVVGVRV